MQGGRQEGRTSASGNSADFRIARDSGIADTDESGRLFAYAVMALSGCVAGFFLSGHFTLALAAFVALGVGGIVGWIARGLAS